MNIKAVLLAGAMIAVSILCVGYSLNKTLKGVIINYSSHNNITTQQVIFPPGAVDFDIADHSNVAITK